jgi:prepilin-type N-terminal cleavage/methylation domain-containing protein/prepilin-type processing-associated H-X9-DG protein
MAVSRRKSAAFTLVEILVVITILGILMAMLLPAVNSVRESMRRTTCKNNLTQIGKAAQQHLAALNHFPSSGWGYNWTGDPDQGFGHKQPGGWVFNILPFAGLDMIHDTAKGLKFVASDINPTPPSGLFNGPTLTQVSSPTRGSLLAESRQAAIPLLYCPTRRRPVAYPGAGTAYYACQPSGGVAPLLGKTDYAANSGSVTLIGAGPSAGSCKNSNCFTDPSPPWSNPDSTLLAFNGVSGERSEVNQIPDGQSNVFFAGEKYLDPQYYATYTNGAENGSALQGNGLDTNRLVVSVPQRDVQGQNSTNCALFGSAHTAGLNFVFCDGHVQLLNFLIDPNTYVSLGVRNDGTYSESY